MKAYTSFAHLQRDLAEGSVNCIQLVEHYLDRIEAHASLNAFLEVYAVEARQRAQEVDAKIKAGNGGRLAGMVIGLKDNICYQGHRLTAASKILGEFESLFSATAVERLLAEDAIIIGRLNCDEFAMGSSNENSAFGPVLNAQDTGKVPGGSSGGSAVAVQAQLCFASLGSDTGGSIRQPASFCGVVGLKPTYGRVSRHGLIAYASSFDQIGPFTHQPEDAALLLEIMAGADAYDSTAALQPVAPYTAQLKEQGPKKVAYLKNALEQPGLDQEVKERTLQTLDRLKAEGYEVTGVDFPYIDYVVPTYLVLSTAEASSNLSRYDGVHYGFRSEDASDIPSTYINTRTEGFGKEVKRRIMLGTFVLSAGYYDAYYSKAQKVRRLIRDFTLEVLQDHDFMVLPTTPHSAFELNANAQDPIAMYLEDIFTVQANLAGVPAVSVPMGNDRHDMPLGLQVLARPFEEGPMLGFSSYLMNNIFSQS
ncbi:MAG: Asp-tRNA(Asn)/Glu-tRNA(Gln) amidotransferase subunit GatA [Salibacteraceae bacterium]